MENEGIMALPQGATMSDEQPQEQMSVTSAQSYDAAQTALGMVNPDALGMLKESLRQSMAELEMTPTELSSLIELLEYMSQRPAEYKQIRQELINSDVIDAEDLPEEYDVEFLGAMLSALNELQMTQAQGAQAPMMDMPPVEGADAMQGMGPMQPMAMAKGGLADVASYLASQGRNGDTMLAHITPEEAELLRSRGGSGTINPVTGLPEFFFKKLGKFVKKAFKGVVNVVKKALKSPIGRILATIALATVLGPAGIGLSLSTAAGVASAGTTLLAGGSVKDALISGAMGYIGGGGTIMGASPVATVGGYLPGAAGSALNTGLATGVIGAGIGKLGGMSTEDALKMGLTSGASAAALQGLQNMKAGDAAAAAPETAPPQQSGTGTATDQIASQTPSGGSVGSVPTAKDLLSMQPPSNVGLKLPASAASAAPGYNLVPPDIPAVSGMGFSSPSYSPYQGSGLNISSASAQAASGPANYSLASPAAAAAAPGIDISGAGLKFPTAPAQAASGSSNLTPPGFLEAFPPKTGDSFSRPVTDQFNKMVTGAKDLYNEYLSPSRPGLPADAGLIRKYAPLALAGTGVIAAAGGMEGTPADENPAFDRSYTGMDYMRENPAMFAGGLGSYTPPSTPYDPIVPARPYNTMPIGSAGVAVPGGLTMQPGGVAQPYNVAGMYGVPLIYGNDGQPQRLAKGGSPMPTKFPRKNGPINGPGTGTSDNIPAMLSDGEFVFTAKSVRNAGNGSRRKGAARMYKLMKMLEGGPVKGK